MLQEETGRWDVCVQAKKKKKNPDLMSPVDLGHLKR